LTHPLPPQLAVLWSITDAVLVADTHTSLVWRCMSATHPGPVIVKALKPTGLWEAKGFDFLDWREGSGAVRLLARDGDCGLMEDGGAIQLKHLHDSGGDAAANPVIIDVVRRLHTASSKPVPASLITMREHFAALYAVASDPPDPALAEPLRWAANLLDQLIATAETIIALHGDIHHENIVSADGSDWRAIDPQGLMGDPAYDVANVFGNPLGSVDLVLRSERINTLATTFAESLGLSKTRVLGFATVHAAVSVCWHLRDGHDLARVSETQERFKLLLALRNLI
jgi:streptomycin 6-kinase